MTTWIPLVSIEEMAKQDYDVLIIGSGAGGSSVLWRLCEKWKSSHQKIGMIEAGDLLLHSHALNIPTVDWNRLEHIFRTNSHQTPGDARFYQTFGLGGRTLFWGMVTPRFSASELSSWPISAHEIARYYHIAEDMMDVTHEYWKKSSIQDEMKQRLHAVGIYSAVDMPVAVNLQSTRQGIIQSNPIWSAINMFGYALHKRPFDLSINTKAIRLIMNGHQATGVAVISHGKKYIIHSKIIVLSGSTFETPRLLLNSNLTNDAIGRYLLIHSKVRAFGYISRKEIPENMGALGILIPGSNQRPYQIQCLGPQNILYNRYPRFKQQPYADQVSIQLECYGEVIPRYSNRVTLDPHSFDDHGIPQIKIEFSYHPQDMNTIQEGASALHRISLAMGIQLYSYDHQPLIHLTGPESSYHEAGTCRMGLDPLTSVTDPSGNIHGVNNVYIADNSVLPSMHTANPTLTTVALAIRTADIIISRLVKTN